MRQQSCLALERATSRVKTKDAGRGSNGGGNRPASCICNVSFPTWGVTKHSCCFREHLTGELLRIYLPRTRVNRSKQAACLVLGARTFREVTSEAQQSHALFPDIIDA